jgi:hypothetical protein
LFILGLLGSGDINSGSANQQSHTQSQICVGRVEKREVKCVVRSHDADRRRGMLQAARAWYSIGPTHTPTPHTHTSYFALRHHAQSCSPRCPAETPAFWFDTPSARLNAVGRRLCSITPNSEEIVSRCGQSLRAAVTGSAETRWLNPSTHLI